MVLKTKYLIKVYQVNQSNSVSLALCYPIPVFGLSGRVQRSFKVMLRSQVKNVAGHYYYAGIVEKQDFSLQLRVTQNDLSKQSKLQVVH